MSEQDQSYEKAWNPLTFRGLATFAASKLPRLLLVEFLFSLLIFFAVISFVSKNYAPIIVQTIHQLPETGTIENQELKGIASRLETDGKFLSLVVDTNDLSRTGTGDLQLAFGQTNILVCSDVSSSWGCLTFPYPKDTIDVSRSNVQPWWGARQPFLIGAFGCCFVIGIFVTLPVLACVLMWLPIFVAYYADRQLTFGGAWRLAIAGQFPGLIVLAAAIILYGTQSLDVLGLAVFYVLHVMVDLVALVGAVFFLPPIANVMKANPFRGLSKP